MRYYFGMGTLKTNNATPLQIQKVADILNGSEHIYHAKQVQPGWVNFEMDGTGGIDYSPLRVLFPLIKVICGFTVHVQEFIDTEEGLFYKSEEDDKCITS